jgi:hypothetical protein
MLFWILSESDWGHCWCYCITSMSYKVVIRGAFKSKLCGLFWLLNSPHGHWDCHPTNRPDDGSPPWITPWVAAVMTVPLQPWHLCPAWIKSPLPAECWRTLKSPSMNSAGVEPLKAFTCDQESVWHGHERCNVAQPCPSKQRLYCRGLDMLYVLTCGSSSVQPRSISSCDVHVCVCVGFRFQRH